MPEKKTAKKEESPNVDSDFLSKDGKKDPNIAALLAIGGMFILGLPSLAYLYVGNSRKALVYSIASWGGAIAGIIISVILAIFTFGLGMLLMFPVALIILALEIAIVIDVYKLAKGEKSILPNY